MKSIKELSSFENHFILQKHLEPPAGLPQKHYSRVASQGEKVYIYSSRM
jgi:hypothetical protein